jgi:hypothetical protein
VDEAPWHLTAKLTEFGEHVIRSSVLNRDSPRDNIVAGEGLIQTAQPIVPAERFEFGQAESPFRVWEAAMEKRIAASQSGVFCTLRVILKPGTYGSP